MTPKNYTLELSLFDLIIYTVNPNFFYYKKVLLKVNKQKEVRKKQKKKKVKHFFLMIERKSKHIEVIISHAS